MRPIPSSLAGLQNRTAWRFHGVSSSSFSSSRRPSLDSREQIYVASSQILDDNAGHMGLWTVFFTIAPLFVIRTLSLTRYYCTVDAYCYSCSSFHYAFPLLPWLFWLLCSTSTNRLRLLAVACISEAAWYNSFHFRVMLYGYPSGLIQSCTVSLITLLFYPLSISCLFKEILYNRNTTWCIVAVCVFFFFFFFFLIMHIYNLMK
jgi:hypothetical protein